MRRHALAAVLCVVVLAACRVDATVTVRMHENGGGTVAVRVVLDAAAVRAAEVGNGTLEQRVRLADLPGAGWSVTPWRRDAKGGATLRIRKPFSAPGEVAGIVREISGANGPVRNVTATRSSSTFSRGWAVGGLVDLRAIKLGIETDPQLVATLTSERVDIPQVESRITSGLSGLRVHLVADLPGAQRDVSAGAGRRSVLDATAENTDLNRLVMLVGGIALAALAVLLLVIGELRARRRRRRAAPVS
ncbi:MAG: hypothetical protein ABIP21_13450 [Acidimicrobiia bacterium]